MITPGPKSWSKEALELIEWFEAQKSLPRGPYALCDGVTVINHELFYERLRSEIAGGPGSPRARTGSLISDLKNLKRVCEDAIW